MKMLTYLYLVLLTPAVFTLELEPSAFEEFRQICERSIIKHLQGEYMTFLPMMLKHNKTMKDCKKTMWQQSECKTCVDSICPTYNFESYPYYERTTLIDWNAWKEVGYTLFGDNLDRFLMMVGKKSAPRFGHDEPKFGHDEPKFILEQIPLHKDMYSIPDSRTLLKPRAEADLFGKRRRRFVRQALWDGRKEMEPEALECMSQCEECRPSNTGFNEETMNYVSTVCGEKVIEHTLRMKAFMDKFSSLLVQNNPENGGVITKIEYNPDNFEVSTLSYGEVYVTAMLPSGPVRYLSQYRLRLQSPEISVIEICEELCSKWGL